MIHGMNDDAVQQRRQLQQLNRPALISYQLDRLNRLLDHILPHNSFYAEKLAGAVRPIASPADLASLPFTTKEELVGGDVTGLATNLTYAVADYVRFHHTSGTHGRPLVVLDTQADWRWWIEAWQYVLDAAELTADDVCLMAFSFGPFIGFWSAFDAAAARGCLVVPGGGLSTATRLAQIRTTQTTCLFCTPSYALHMADVAEQQGMELRELSVRTVVVAGEPGGSVPAVRRRIETAWDAQVLDHSGASEIGPWGFGNLEGPGLFVNEAEFIAEFRSVDTGDPAAEGELAELVITGLGRSGCPVIRYRTGDLVRPAWQRPGPLRFVWLEGGVLGRADDMMIIRGVNIFPSSVDQIVRGFSEVAEYRMTASKQGALDRLEIEIEHPRNDPQDVADALRTQLGLSVDVRCVPPGSLPRFEAKGRRFIDRRNAAT